MVCVFRKVFGIRMRWGEPFDVQTHFQAQTKTEGSPRRRFAQTDRRSGANFGSQPGRIAPQSVIAPPTGVSPILALERGTMRCRAMCHCELWRWPPNQQQKEPICNGQPNGKRNQWPPMASNLLCHADWRDPLHLTEATLSERLDQALREGRGSLESETVMRRARDGSQTGSERSVGSIVVTASPKWFT